MKISFKFSMRLRKEAVLFVCFFFGRFIFMLSVLCQSSSLRAYVSKFRRLNRYILQFHLHCLNGHKSFNYCFELLCLLVLLVLYRYFVSCQITEWKLLMLFCCVYVSRGVCVRVFVCCFFVHSFNISWNTKPKKNCFKRFLREWFLQLCDWWSSVIEQSLTKNKFHLCIERSRARARKRENCLKKPPQCHYNILTGGPSFGHKRHTLTHIYIIDNCYTSTVSCMFPLKSHNDSQIFHFIHAGKRWILVDSAQTNQMQNPNIIDFHLFI